MFPLQLIYHALQEPETGASDSLAENTKQYRRDSIHKPGQIAKTINVCTV